MQPIKEKEISEFKPAALCYTQKPKYYDYNNNQDEDNHYHTSINNNNWSF